MSKFIAATVVFIALFSLGASKFVHADPMAAKRHMARGMAAMEMAKSPANFRDAVEEFSKAVKEAPDWADAWFNLGVAQESAEDYQAAIKSFKTYLKKAPEAADRDAIGTRIYKLEYKVEMAQKGVQEKKEKLSADELAGYWGSQIFPSIRVIVESRGSEVLFSHIYGTNKANGDPVASFTLAGFQLHNGAFTSIAGVFGKHPGKCEFRIIKTLVTGIVSNDKNTITLTYDKPWINSDRGCAIEYKKITETFRRLHP
jgi:tetratricopeptide (TPR) repeat protein